MMGNPILEARLAMLPFAALLWLVAWSIRFLPIPIKNPFVRILTQLTLLAIISGDALGQIYVYRSLSGLHPDLAADHVFDILLIGEYVVGLYLILASAFAVDRRNATHGRTLSGPDYMSTSTDNTKRPILPPLRQKFVMVLLLGVACLGLAAGFLMQWERPVSLYLATASWFCFFTVLVLLTALKDREHALRLQRFMLIAFACIEFPMLALFWKFQASSPAFSSAALAAAVMLCIGATLALVVMRRITPRN